MVALEHLGEFFSRGLGCAIAKHADIGFVTFPLRPSGPIRTRGAL